MPRKPGIFIYRNFFYTGTGGKKRKLCPVSDGRRKAEIALARLVVELEEFRAKHKGYAYQKKNGNSTVAEVHDLFLDFKKSEVDPETFKGYVRTLKPFFKMFASRKISELTENDGIKYKNYLLTEHQWGKKVKHVGLGRTTTSMCIRSAKTLFKWATHPKRAFLHHNPWFDVKPPTENARKRVFTDEEFEKLISVCTSPTHKDILVGLRWSAMRPGELFKLKYEWIEWERDLIIIPFEFTKTRSTTKQGGPRLIPILPEFKEVLQRRLSKYGKTKLVFQTKNGTPFWGTLFATTFILLRRRAGLDAADHHGEKLCSYSLRHTRLTEMAVKEKWALPLVQLAAGHTQIKTTLRYTHPSVDDLVQAALQGREKRIGDSV